MLRCASFYIILLSVKTEEGKYWNFAAGELVFYVERTPEQMVVRLAGHHEYAATWLLDPGQIYLTVKDSSASGMHVEFEGKYLNS